MSGLVSVHVWMELRTSEAASEALWAPREVVLAAGAGSFDCVARERPSIAQSSALRDCKAAGAQMLLPVVQT